MSATDCTAQDRPAEDPAASTKQFFTTHELAARWEVSIRKVQELASSGEIASMRVGRTVRIPTSAVRSFERSNTRRPGETKWAS